MNSAIMSNNHKLIQQIKLWVSVVKGVEEDTIIVNKELISQFLSSIEEFFKKQSELHISLCSFCRNNKESPEMYRSHKLKDAKGHIQCPILRRYSCPLCGATGDNAHTIKYCGNAKH